MTAENSVLPPQEKNYVLKYIKIENILDCNTISQYYFFLYFYWNKCSLGKKKKKKTFQKH